MTDTTKRDLGRFQAIKLSDVERGVAEWHKFQAERRLERIKVRLMIGGVFLLAVVFAGTLVWLVGL